MSSCLRGSRAAPAWAAAGMMRQLAAPGLLQADLSDAQPGGGSATRPCGYHPAVVARLLGRKPRNHWLDL